MQTPKTFAVLTGFGTQTFTRIFLLAMNRTIDDYVVCRIEENCALKSQLIKGEKV